MPTRRTRRGRAIAEHRITADAIAAWRSADYLALHAALGLHPHEASPLPLSVTALGVDQRTPEENAAKEYKFRIWQPSWPLAQELQRQLLQIAGAPGGADE